MNKFIKRFGVFILPIMICFTLGEYRLRTNNSFYFQEKFIQENKEDIGCLIFGASHNWRAVNPELLNIKTASLAHAGGAINIDFLLFNKYINELPNLEVIIFPISTHTLEDNRDGDWNKNHLLYIYHGINNYAQKIPFKDYFLLTANFKNYLQKLIDSTQYFNQYGYMYREESAISIDGSGNIVLSKKIKSKLKNHQKKGNEKVFLQNTTQLNQLIQKCLNRNIKVVLLSPPKLAPFNNIETTSRARRNGFLERYEDTPNVYIWNEERIYEDQPDLFYDINHMNTKGATIFTAKLDSLLNTILE